MKSIKMAFYKKLITPLIIVITVLCVDAIPILNAQNLSNYTTLPRSLDPGVAPMVMLAMSNDHQLYFKAYTDYDDLDPPDAGVTRVGVLNSNEITYDNTFNYSGYFESNYCYGYSGSGATGAFVIQGAASNHYCDAVSAGRWSGNFLNWATMTRIDMLRHILYGGKRVEDTATTTVLARSYLPNDAHSFAKFYKGENLNRLTPYADAAGITLCNTTLHNSVQSNSLNNNQPPLMRVVLGNYALWASGERHQCLLNSERPANGPSNSGEAYSDSNTVNYFNVYGGFAPNGQPPAAVEADLSVRVVTCPNAYAQNIPRCKAYGNVFKPVGVLQRFGGAGEINWGLMTGGYYNNKTGGVLRVRPSSIVSAINADGTLVKTGDSIFGILDAVRISAWQWPNNGTSYTDNCAWGFSEFPYRTEAVLRATYTNHKCTDWGNPLGEILAESYRFFAGATAPTVATPIGANNAEIGAPSGVTVALWDQTHAFNDQAYSCANLNVIGLNTASHTFEDELDNFYAGINGVTDEVVTSFANTIGTQEGVSGNYFLGETDVSNNKVCTPKLLNNLASAKGDCPDAPSRSGTWKVAGLARFVSGLSEASRDINLTLNKSQQVTTHGIQLSAALPQVSVAVGSQIAVISPFCEDRGGYNDSSRAVVGNCALVDFRVLSLIESANGDISSGAFYVNWEDSEQGGDYDQDMHGIISFTVNANTLNITTRVIGQSTTRRLAFGYVLSGLGQSNDGIHVYSGVNGYSWGGCALLNDAKVYDYDGDKKMVREFASGLTGCGSNNERALALPFTATNAGAVAKKLESPLFYASKASGGVFVKDNNPARLDEDFTSILTNLGPKPLAGGGEVAATLGAGGDNIYLHTIYYAQREDANKNRIHWIGQIGAMFLDAKGRLREDTDGNDALSADDKVIEFDSVNKDTNGQPLVNTYGLAANGDTDLTTKLTKAIETIQYIWTTTQALNAVTPAARNIYTALPVLAPGASTDVITLGEQPLMPFTANLLPRHVSPFLGGAISVPNLVSYIRGDETLGDNYRSRSLGATKYIMGDVITSPVIQGPPNYSYAKELGDADYLTYQNKYKTRERIVYAAANDGMIHAFYAAGGNATAAAEFTLGQELWGYIPFNLLPHLQWLPNKRYQRVPYFDGYMRTFDVKIFAPSDDYPGGWGTILVVGTGLGGGAYGVNMDGDPTTAEFTTRPAYIVLDITRRAEAPPKLIAEVSHAQLGFTTGEPDVARYENANGSAWFLVFGSGPRGYEQAGTRVAQLNYVVPAPAVETAGLNKKPALFAFNLKTKQLQAPTVLTAAPDNAFIGGINSMDWNRDFADDALYFGTIAGDQANPSGNLIRAKLSLTGSTLGMAASVVFDTQKPVVARPTTAIDYRNNYWVFAGTGRYFVRADGNQNHNNNMYLGLIEEKDDAANAAAGSVKAQTVVEGDLFDSTAVGVKPGGALTGAANTVVTPNTPISHIATLRTHISQNKKGWYRYFGFNERQHTTTGYLASTLFVSTSIPGRSNRCDSKDAHNIYVFDMRSGVYSPFSTRLAAQVDVGSGYAVEVGQVIPLTGGNGPEPEMNDPSSQIINLG